MIPIIIDIEASGFGSGSYPIEIGVALPDQKTHCYIIRPADSWTFWDDAAEAVHGIPRKVLQEKGKEPELVARRLNALLKEQTVYTDAWSYDLCWLGKLYDLTGIPQRFRLEALRTLLTEEQAAMWHPIKDQVIEDLKLSRHRASTDALILQETFRRLQNASPAQSSTIP